MSDVDLRCGPYQDVMRDVLVKALAVYQAEKKARQAARKRPKR